MEKKYSSKCKLFFKSFDSRNPKKVLIFGKLDFVVKKSLAEEKSDPLKKGVVNFVFFDSWKC